MLIFLWSELHRGPGNRLSWQQVFKLAGVHDFTVITYAFLCDISTHWCLNFMNIAFSLIKNHFAKLPRNIFFLPGLVYTATIIWEQQRMKKVKHMDSCHRTLYHLTKCTTNRQRDICSSCGGNLHSWLSIQPRGQPFVLFAALVGPFNVIE